jgi:hypothetical protein
VVGSDQIRPRVTQESRDRSKRLTAMSSSSSGTTTGFLTAFFFSEAAFAAGFSASYVAVDRACFAAYALAAGESASFLGAAGAAGTGLDAAALASLDWPMTLGFLVRTLVLGGGMLNESASSTSDSRSDLVRSYPW